MQAIVQLPAYSYKCRILKKNLYSLRERNLFFYESISSYIVLQDNPNIKLNFLNVLFI